MSSCWSKVVIASLFSGTSDVNHWVKYPGVGRASIEEASYLLWWVSNEHVWDVGVVFKIILNNMCLHLLSWFINWAVCYIINASLSLCLRTWLSWLWGWNAAIQLNVISFNWSWLGELSHSVQIKFKVALSLSKINWLSIDSNISGLFSQGFGLLRDMEVDGLSSILNANDIEQRKNSKRDLH